jgi:hypothetical protein
MQDENVYAEVRESYYATIENQFKKQVAVAVENRNFIAVENEFLDYGQYLMSHPDALPNEPIPAISFQLSTK